MNIKVFIDGACRNNGSKTAVPQAACAFAIYKNKTLLAQYARGLGIRTVNEAEYEALINALLACSMSGYPRPSIYSDSAVVVNQIKGKWRCSDKKLFPLYLSVKEIEAEYPFDLFQVPRSKVFIPDMLCNLFLDKLAQHQNQKVTQ